MEPANQRFGGGSAETLLHPLVALAMVITIVLILFLPRRQLIVPVLLAIFWIPNSQVVLVVGLHFTVQRIVLMAALGRVAASHPFSRLGMFAGGMNRVDRMFVAWRLIYVVNFSVQWMAFQALIKASGDLLDALTGYFVLRFLIRDKSDVIRTIKTLGLVAVFMALCMVNEQRTGANIYAQLGGMPPTTVRDGKVRSQAAFAVFLTAGAFGSTLLPLFVWLCSQRKHRLVASLGLASASVITVTCYASTSLMSGAAGLFALCCWPLRRVMRLVRWGIVVLVIALHVIMNGPVWSLIEKIDLTGSSSSYHRYMLVDNFIRHWDDWLLIGYRHYDRWGFTMWDLGNQYVAEGLTGGLVTFVLFIMILSQSFAWLGNTRKLISGKCQEEWFLWCIGAALFAHAVSNFGIGYFDQVVIAWYAVLAMIAAVASPTVGNETVPSRRSASDEIPELLKAV